jgi:hypothetical protein
MVRYLQGQTNSFEKLIVKDFIHHMADFYSSRIQGTPSEKKVFFRKVALLLRTKFPLCTFGINSDKRHVSDATLKYMEPDILKS